MELRQYWQVIRRRLWIVIVLLFMVSVVSFRARSAGAPTYRATMRFIMGLGPEEKRGDYYAYDRYYTWLTAEYLIDDTAELVRSNAFAQAVSDRLSHREINVPAGAIQGSTQAGQLHRILTVSVTWADESQLGDIANTVADILPGEIAKHFAQVGTSGVSASLVDPPAVGMVAASLREKLDLPLRLLLAVVVGVALALVLDYLDDTVRTRQELEESGVNVLAEIPPVQRNGLRFRRPWLP